MNVVKSGSSYLVWHFACRHINCLHPQLAVGHVSLTWRALTAQGLHLSYCKKNTQNALEKVREGIAVIAQRANLFMILRLRAYRRIEARHELGALHDQINVAVDAETLEILDSMPPSSTQHRPNNEASELKGRHLDNGGERLSYFLLDAERATRRSTRITCVQIRTERRQYRQ